MKKTGIILSALLLVLSMTGCTAADSADQKETDSLPEESRTEESSASEQTETEEQEAGKYQPGTYTGESEGYTGTITVSVTVDGEHILSITVTDEQEGKIGEKVYGDMTAAMLQKNSPDVEAVSGATVTSGGFQRAVYAALAEAKAE